MAMATSRFGFLLQTQLLRSASPLHYQPLVSNALFATASKKIAAPKKTTVTPVKVAAPAKKVAIPAKKVAHIAAPAKSKPSDKEKVKSKNADIKGKVNLKEKEKAKAPLVKKPADKEKEKAKAAADKEKAKAAADKEKAKKEQEKEKAKAAADKEKAKAAALKEKEKEKSLSLKEKEKSAAAKEKAKKDKEKEKAKAIALKEKEKAKVQAIAANRIPKALSAYNFFVKSTFPVVKKENPDLTTFADISKRVREQWVEAEDAVKQPFLQLAEEALKNSRAQREARKKPATGFALYVKENYHDQKEKSPAASLSEISQKLAQKWKSLSTSELAKYKQIADSKPKKA